MKKFFRIVYSVLYVTTLPIWIAPALLIMGGWEMIKNVHYNTFNEEL